MRRIPPPAPRPREVTTPLPPAMSEPDREYVLSVIRSRDDAADERMRQMSAKTERKFEDLSTQISRVATTVSALNVGEVEQEARIKNLESHIISSTSKASSRAGLGGAGIGSAVATIIIYAAQHLMHAPPPSRPTHPPPVHEAIE